MALLHMHSTKLLPTSFGTNSSTFSKPSIRFSCSCQNNFTRRAATSAAAAALGTTLLSSSASMAIEFKFVAPDQTPEEANAVVRTHAKKLLKIKPLIDSESWHEAQIALRESSSLLKQDLYTIIQSKASSERPQLRKLYTQMFNSVSRLDYAARSKDADLVQQCYNNIAENLEQMLSRIS